MNQFFTKLQSNAPDIDYSVLKGKPYFRYEKSSLSYYHLNSDYKDLLKQSLPESFFKIIPYTILYVEITDNETLPPHIDFGITCSINFYFNPGDAIVYWYVPNNEAKEKINSEKKTRLYKTEDITLSDILISEKNDCYLFNNSKIHSVAKKNDTLRQFIQIQYYQPYEKILEKLGAN